MDKEGDQSLDTLDNNSDGNFINDVDDIRKDPHSITSNQDLPLLKSQQISNEEIIPNQDLGLILRKIRDGIQIKEPTGENHNKLTQKLISEVLAVSESYVNLIENNQKDPPCKIFYAIIKLLFYFFSQEEIRNNIKSNTNMKENIKISLQDAKSNKAYVDSRIAKFYSEKDSREIKQLWCAWASRILPKIGINVKQILENSQEFEGEGEVIKDPSYSDLKTEKISQPLIDQITSNVSLLFQEIGGLKNSINGINAKIDKIITAKPQEANQLQNLDLNSPDYYVEYFQNLG